MNELIKFENGEILADSRMIAEHFGKQHAHVMRDIKDELEKLGDLGQSIFGESSYANEQNRFMPCYTMNEEGIMQLAARYDAVARRKLIVMIKEFKEKQPKLSSLQILELQLQAMKEQEKKLNQVEHRVDVIAETISYKADNWREGVNQMLNKVGKIIGYSEVRTKSYEELDRRGGANLKQRLINAKARLEEQGVSRSKIDKFNYMDVIEQDKRLKEIYLIIVKEMHVKHCSR